MNTPKRGASVEERVWFRTDRTGGPESCWRWTGSTGQGGGPTMVLAGSTKSVRRVVYEMATGEKLEPRDLVVVTCDHKWCLNPKHLFREFGDITKRFWQLVKKEDGDGCWEWQGYYFESGYGGIKIDQKQRQAHRVSWELAHGPIEGHVPGHPDLEVCVCHRCDNPRCVRPDHLFLGTDADNHRDAEAKGRVSRGEKHSKLMREAKARWRMTRVRIASGAGPARTSGGGSDG